VIASAAEVAAFVLPFEKPVVELVTRVRELRALAQADRHFEAELKRLEERRAARARALRGSLALAKGAAVAAPEPPVHARLRRALFTDFQELHGDRAFADDASIVAGFAKYADAA